MSLNFPPVEQVVGARATRTTHPKVIQGLNRLFEALFNQAFEVRNPFIWQTRAEVVKRIADHGFSDMIRHTVSCTRIRDMTNVNPHCGLCWQCIDRQFSMIATGLEEADPAEAYKVSLFEGERRKGPDREMALSYVRLATHIQQMPDVAFFNRFGEANRIVDCFDDPANIIGERIYQLYQRHAKGVCAAIDEALKRNVAALREQALSPHCLLSLVARNSPRNAEDHRLPRLTRFADAFRDTRVAIAIDEANRRVIIDRWGTIKGRSADILIALAIPFRKAVAGELPPESFEFTRSDALCRRLGCDEPGLRQQIARCRKKIETYARTAGVDPPGTDSVIENISWSGYRLNPDHVRIAAVEELTGGPV